MWETQTGSDGFLKRESWGGTHNWEGLGVRGEQHQNKLYAYTKFSLSKIYYRKLAEGELHKKWCEDRGREIRVHTTIIQGRPEAPKLGGAKTIYHYFPSTKIKSSNRTKCWQRQ